MAFTRNVQQQGCVKVVMAIFTSVPTKKMTMSSCTSGLQLDAFPMWSAYDGGVPVEWGERFRHKTGFVPCLLKVSLRRHEDQRFILDVEGFWDEIFV